MAVCGSLLIFLLLHDHHSRNCWAKFFSNGVAMKKGTTIADLIEKLSPTIPRMMVM